MARPVFGSDIDDTLLVGSVEQFFDWLVTIDVPHCRRTYAATHSWEQAIPGHSADQLFQEFYLSGNAPQPTPMPGAQAAMQIIAAHCDVHLVTRRNDVTIQQIKTYLQTTFFATPPDIWACGGKPKQEKLREIGARFFVDDSRDELARLDPYAGITLIQFPSFHGEEPSSQRVEGVIRLKACDLIGQQEPSQLRAQAWQEIVEIVCNTPL